MEKTTPPKIFDQSRIEAIAKRAARRASKDAGFLYDLATETIIDRLNATNRNFELSAALFSDLAPVTTLLKQSEKTKNVIEISAEEITDRKNEDGNVKLAENREFLPLGERSVNLITSIFGLHRINDLPGMLTQINRALKPDGLLTTCLPGDRTLNELRSCLIEAESALCEGVSMRVDPFVELRQAGALLQRAGFALPVVDSDLLTVRYDSLQDIVADLRSMAATSTFVSRASFGPKELFKVTEDIYRTRFADPDGRLRVTVEIIYLSGWKPDPSQQQPLKPGSAIKNLKDVL